MRAGEHPEPDAGGNQDQAAPAWRVRNGTPDEYSRTTYTRIELEYVAAQAAREAERATLANVRERHLVARDTWTEMADKAESVIATRAATEAEKRALAETA